MCLDRVSKFKPKKNGIGYKVFYHPRKHYYSLFRGNMKPMREGQWLGEKSFRENTFITQENIRVGRCPHVQSYPQGFHFFTNKQDAQYYVGQEPNWVLRTIQYRKATTKGKWANDGTIVAKEIFIPKE